MPIKYFELMLALRWLKPKKGEGFVSLIAGFSLLGIALGVAALIVVLAVMNGFRQDLTARLLAFSGHVLVYDTEAEEKIADLDGVKKAFTVTQTQALAVGRAGYNTGVVVRALGDGALEQLEITFSPSAADGIENGTALVGEKLARRLGLGVGGGFTLLSPQPAVTLFGAAPRLKRFEIAATFAAGNYQYDNFYLFITAADAAELFAKISPHLEVFLDDPYEVAEIETQIRNLVPQANTENWQQQNKELFAALNVEKRVMTLILALIILVASFNIVSGLVIQVKNRSKEIAVLRSLGCSKGSVLRIVMINGMLLGIIGVALGVLGGVALADNLEAIRRWVEGWSGVNLFAEEIYLLTKLPADIRLEDVTAVAIAAAAIATLASFGPAYQAANREPTKGLRNE